MGKKSITIKIEDNRRLIEDELETAIKKALMQCGETAINYATKACPVDTGLLRNSLAYARGGERPSPASYSANDGSNTGTYDGSASADSENKYTLYIGTNVEYAEAVECGLGQEAQPYLVPAIKNHTRKYRTIIQSTLKSE